ncbi:MAG: nucleotidyltransferase family protein [Candidatus Schekmanbacteria bacterium]|nr:MAG: nucleotidyltransferase family protein [Candidatus Schekmanbacteria bacterium]
MKAFLLAAGLGTRLRPLTNEIPKCLVPIAGKPLIYYWFQLFEKYEISEVLINLHYLPDKLRSFVEELKTSIKVELFYEKELLGSAGTVFYNKGWVGSDERFLVVYADNLTNIDISKFLRFHHKKKGLMTIGLFEAENPRECGIVDIDSSSRICGFYEKVENPPGNLANAGIYVAESKIFDIFEFRKPLDFGFDILPKLTGQIYGYKIQEYFIDIGTPENYKKACAEWEKILNKGES